MALLLSLLLISSNIASHFKELPQELLHSKIYSLFGVKDIITSVARLNSDTYHNYFLRNHQKQLNTIHTLIAYIKDKGEGITSFGIAFIRTLSNRVHLNEIYALKLPKLLDEIKEMYSERDARRIMNAMDVSYMGIDRICDLPQDINFKLRLLILSSRAIVPGPSSETSRRRFRGYPDIYRMTVYINEYLKIPWRTYPAFMKLGMHTFYFVHLYQYLFDHFHNALNIPKLDSVFVANDELSNEKKVLIELRHAFGLVLWHRDTMRVYANETMSLMANVHFAHSLGEMKKMSQMLSKLMCSLSSDESEKLECERFFSRFTAHLNIHMLK